MEWLTNSPWLILAGIALAAFLESLAVVGIIVPGIVLLFSLAALANNANIHIALVLFYGGIGAATGDLLSYAIGNKLKFHLFEGTWFAKHKNWIDQGAWFIEKWGWLSVIIGRFLGPLRPIIPLLTGALGMAPSRFIPLSLLTVFMWAPVYLLPGYYTGELADLWQLQPLADRSLMIFVLSIMSIATAALVIYHHTHPEQMLIRGWLTRDQADRWPIQSSNLALLSVIIFTIIYFQAPLERDLEFHQWSIDWQTYQMTQFWSYIAKMNHESLVLILISSITFWLILSKKVSLAFITMSVFAVLSLAAAAIEAYAPIEKEFTHLGATSSLIYLIAFIANLYSNSLHGLKRWPGYLVSFGFMLTFIISLIWTDQVSASAGIASLCLGLLCSALVRILWKALQLSLYVPRPGGITCLLFTITVAFAAIA
ncbi:DedA family protein [Reinekea sp.]|jgi:membrane protein DedA with SNARE-associated domain|uniref:DedA family protein n=1 Tax=Reinekea sp. TaxID=1970455 RepID=UPI00398A1784